ncbi:hypothetical protein HJG60_010866 [Phyllostomus discolor]|uniref:Uncharacterized protein n=1 Tax=Phyllostomus discolor TaxID=89673 RepID=A0A834ADM2_9CHIR|nr:hypothetical protein HJG60_010866 [Phyllostomus discolor]
MWLAGPYCPESISPSLPEPVGLSLLFSPPLLPELTVLQDLPGGLRESPRSFSGNPVSKMWGPGTLAPISQEGGENPREQCSACSPFRGSPQTPSTVEADEKVYLSHPITFLVFSASLEHLFFLPPCHRHMVLVAGVMHTCTVFELLHPFPCPGGVTPVTDSFIHSFILWLSSSIYHLSIYLSIYHLFIYLSIIYMILPYLLPERI